MKSPVDPISGFNAPGPRFKARIRSISHNNMYLPIQMRDLHFLKELVNGASPLQVFHTSTIEQARAMFFRIRKCYDFPYWASTDFKIRDISNPHSIVPLRLNKYQHYLVDTLIRTNLDGKPKQYLIAKSIPRCGLTTCVQAYILWLKNKNAQNTLTCAPDDFIKEDMIADVNRLLDKQRSYSGISMNDFSTSTFYHSFYTPHILYGISANFIHLADMSKWYDHPTETTSHILSNTLRNWIRQKAAVYIMEGDKPSDPDFRMEDYQNPYVTRSFRLMQISDHCKNPLFVEKIIQANTPRLIPNFTYIDLDKAPSSATHTE